MWGYHFIRDASKTLTGLTSSRGFDGRIEGQKLGLLSNIHNHIGDLADFSGRLPQLVDTVQGCGDACHRCHRHLAHFFSIPGDFANGAGHLIRGRRDGLNITAGLLRNDGYRRHIRAHGFGSACRTR